VVVVLRVSKEARLAETAAAGDLKLSAAEIAALDKAFPRGPKPRSLPML
jgi:diketogulonate reductase-like aldo/keto reductase